jgi:hypothetical protein
MGTKLCEFNFNRLALSNYNPAESLLRLTRAPEGIATSTGSAV